MTGSGVGHADTADHTDHTDQSEQSGQSGGAGPSARKADAARSRPAKAGSQPAPGTVESATNPAPAPRAGTDPDAPVQSPVAWAALAVARRQERSQQTTTPAPSATVASTGPSVDYRVTDDWGTGHVASVSVAAGQSALNG